MVSRKASEGFMNVSKSVLLPKGTALKEMLWKWMKGYLFLCNKPVLGTC
jgi:hypothetical protein